MYPCKWTSSGGSYDLIETEENKKNLKATWSDAHANIEDEILNPSRSLGSIGCQMEKATDEKSGTNRNIVVVSLSPSWKEFVLARSTHYHSRAIPFHVIPSSNYRPHTVRSPASSDPRLRRVKWFPFCCTDYSMYNCKQLTCPQYKID